MEDEKQGEGFVVKDKRLFNETGEVKPRDEDPQAAAHAAQEKSAAAADKLAAEDKQADYPPVDFTNFVLSLSTSALFHFGDIPGPEGVVQKNLAAAKQTIDILNMLNEKTKGNLNEQENKLIQGALYELKMRYVKEKV